MTETCKFCGRTARLVESHVIPKCFFIHIKSGAKPLQMVTNVHGQRNRRSHTGIYGRFVCLQCEKLFSKPDDYASRLFIRGRNLFRPVLEDGETIALQLDSFDYPLIKLFFISLLWRASVCSHPFYSRVSTGPFESRARLLIENSDPGSEHDFSVVLNYWEANRDHKFLLQSMMDPFEHRLRGISTYVFLLADIVCYIKVDSRNFPSPMDGVMLRPNEPMYLVSRPVEGSGHYRAIMSLFKSSSRISPWRKNV